MGKFWTEAENELIRLHYPDKKTDDIVCFFTDRTARVIRKHAGVIGVKKSEAFMKSPLSGRISKDNDIGISTRFTKQMPGWNKGKKQSDYMSPEMIERIKKTRFKKGQDPHNTQLIGYERITKDGYVEVKVRHSKDGDAKNKNFELKHRLMWVEKYGPVPDGMVVSIKGNDKINFSIDDLELITMKENLIRNSMCDSSIVKRFFKLKEPREVAEMIEKYPELIRVKKNILKLKSKINESKRKINRAVNG